MRGNKRIQFSISERRANAAKDYLMTYGVSADRISWLVMVKKDQLIQDQIHFHGLKIEDQLL